MEKSSKDRLTPQQESLFPGISLFDKIARAVCRAGTLPRKELHEARDKAIPHMMIPTRVLRILQDDFFERADQKR